ncbi:MAG: extracellular solute-binding protein [Beijerinckiaceae bacterium]|jgi:ABC-type Fe3+ transport system substrate-binding protein|nr:extracellular solute-binding protein [Beijerinckiaceae bacterium]
MRSLFRAAAIAAALCAGISILPAAELGKSFDEIVAGAKKEGKLVVWSPLPGRPETHQAVIKAFNERFGLNTQLEWVPMAAPTANTRATAEAAGRRVSVDVIGGASIGEIITARDAGLIKPFDYAGTFGNQFPSISQIDGLPGYKGLGLLYMVAHNGIAWNTKMIADDQVPNKASEFADPKHRGKFGVNAFFLVPLDILSTCIGEEQALKIADGIIANRPVQGRGSPAVNQFITTGQVPFGMTISLVAEAAIRNREPLKFKMYSDYVISTENYVYVPENSPNPNTARLFAAWHAAESYKIIDPIESLPSILDASNPYIKMASENVSKGAKACKIQNEANIAQMLRVREKITLKLSGQQ